jgi:lipopolysaccharide transport system permease protein
MGRLALQFAERELKERLTGNLLGTVWFVIVPLLQLVVFSLVFGTLFDRQAGFKSAQHVPYVCFLALGLWPWLMFADSVSRGIMALQANANIIRKMRFRSDAIVVGVVAANFFVHFIGLVIVCIALFALDNPISIRSLPIVLLIMLPLFALAVGCALLVSALQVFVRDLSHVIPPMIGMLYFMTPILYSRESAAPALRGYLDVNPLTPFVELARNVMLGVPSDQLNVPWSAMLVSVSMLGIGLIVFRRLSPHFDDFL